MNSVQRTCKAWSCRNLFSRIEFNISGEVRCSGPCAPQLPATNSHAALGISFMSARRLPSVSRKKLIHSS